MCGITGIYSSSENVDKKIIQAMTDVVKHRGPDDKGYYFNKGIAFGHRRLSIIDLSTNGRQPMCNEDETVWIVFNGEIYNYLELKKTLVENHEFKSQTDTEVIIHLYEEFGTDCLSYLNGMFAFAIYDSKKDLIFCARDRFGVKPLYYYFDGHSFFFGSEIKSILAHPRITPKVNEQAFYNYLYRGISNYSDETLFKNIHQVRPSEFLILTKQAKKLDITKKFFYSIKSNPKDRAKIYDNFYDILKDSVRLRLQSDVPVGVLLSGGLDSSTIAYLANLELGDNNKISMFSAGSKELGYDESFYAKLVGEELGVEPHVIYSEGFSLVKDLKEITKYYEYPVPGPSIFSHYKMLEKIKEKNIKVIIQGQGSDELLGGYNSFNRSYLAEFLRTKKYKDFYQNLSLISKKYSLSKRQLFFSSIKKRYVDGYQPSKNPINNPSLSRSFSFNSKIKLEVLTDNFFINESFQNIACKNLPYILQYEDRNSMAFSLESRNPFLDYRLVDYCFNLPMKYKMHKGEKKVILKKVMSKKLPSAIIKRRKRGYPTPTDKWLISESRSEVSEIIESKSFAGRKFFDQKKTINLFDKYVKGHKKSKDFIWKAISSEIWLREFIDNNSIN